MKQLKSWFFSTVRGLNSRNKFINLADFGEPDQITFTDLLDTTLTKKIDNSNYQDQASPADIISKSNGDKFVNPASLPDVALSLGSILTLGTSTPDTITPRRIYIIDAPLADNTDIDTRINSKFTTPANMPVVTVDPTAGNIVSVTPLTAGGLTTYSLYANATIVFANSLFVDPNGNDGLAQRGSFSKPFATINAAKTASLVGDTIVVFPGTYTITSTINKNGITYYFFPGARVTSNFAGGMLSDLGVPSTCVIRGFGEFIQLHTDGKIGTISGTSLLDIQCKSIIDNRNLALTQRGCLVAIFAGKIILRDVELFDVPTALPLLSDSGGTLTVINSTVKGHFDCVAEARVGSTFRAYNSQLLCTDAVNNTPVLAPGAVALGTNTIELHDCILQNSGTGFVIHAQNSVQNITFKGTNVLIAGTNPYTLRSTNGDIWQNLGKLFRNKPTDPVFAIGLLYGDDVVNPGITYNIP